ncbi:MAG: hypothetical protein ABI467_06915 [Kofleriaceae bacterium]
MKWLLILALVACSRNREHQPAVERSAHVETPPKLPATPIGPTTTQLVTAVPDEWDSTTATMRLWHREAGTDWQPVGAPWPVVIGANGAAWGIGLHGNGPPAGHTGPAKLEGDQKSPAGSFLLGPSYGYAAAPPKGTKLPYTPTDDQIKCVDDPGSLHYGTIVNQLAVQPDWHSAENLRRPDALYTWVIDVAHNPSRVPGDGSCIFLHVWKDPHTPTVGCTAMAEPQVQSLLAELDPAQVPVFVLLPQREYASLAAAWGLPTL